MVIQGFDQSKQWPLGKIYIKIRFDEVEDFVDLLGIYVDAAYNAILGRTRMHKNATIQSTYHQRVKYLLRGAQGTKIADNDSFVEVEAYYADGRFYRMMSNQEKEKLVLQDEDILRASKIFLCWVHHPPWLNWSVVLPKPIDMPKYQRKERRKNPLFLYRRREIQKNPLSFVPWIIWKVMPKTKGMTVQKQSLKLDMNCFNKKPGQCWSRNKKDLATWEVSKDWKRIRYCCQVARSPPRRQVIPRSPKAWLRWPSLWKSRVHRARQGISWIWGGRASHPRWDTRGQVWFRRGTTTYFVSGIMSPEEKGKCVYSKIKMSFAWTYSEMSGFDLTIAMHHMAIEPERHLVKHILRCLHLELSQS